MFSQSAWPTVVSDGQKAGRERGRETQKERVSVCVSRNRWYAETVGDCGWKEGGRRRRRVKECGKKKEEEQVLEMQRARKCQGKKKKTSTSSETRKRGKWMTGRAKTTTEEASG